MTDPSSDLAQKRKALLDQKRHVTEKVSDLCRFIGFGLLAIFYTMQIGTTEFAVHIREDRSFLLVGIGLSGALSVFFDYVQFLCGVYSVENALHRASQDYDETSWLYWGRQKAFIAKQIATLAGVILLMAIVIA